MSVETASYISQLNPAYPAAGDLKSEGDDHMRLIKGVLQTQFPNLGASAVTPTAAQLNNVTNAALRTGDTFTGTHDFTGATINVPTQSATDNDTSAASTAFVQSAILASSGISATLPAQTGNSGKFLTTNGTSASWAASGQILRSARTSNTILSSSDQSSLIDITSGTFTQTFTAAATLGSGWWCYIRNSGTGDITLDPNGSETIDGVTSGLLKAGMTILVQCDGTAFNAVRVGPQCVVEVLTSGTSWTCPVGVRVAEVTCIGGGGGPTTTNTNCGGGGGTAIKTLQLTPGASYSYAIGAAGTGTSSGGNTTFTASVVVTANGGTASNPGVGGGASNGDINVKGGCGSTAANGIGGASLYGAGASGSLSAATGYGGGGVFSGSAWAATQGAIFIKY